MLFGFNGRSSFYIELVYPSIWRPSLRHREVLGTMGKCCGDLWYYFSAMIIIFVICLSNWFKYFSSCDVNFLAVASFINLDASFSHWFCSILLFRHCLYFLIAWGDFEFSFFSKGDSVEVYWGFVIASNCMHSGLSLRYYGILSCHRIGWHLISCTYRRWNLSGVFL